MSYLTKVITARNNDNIKYISKLLNSSKFRNQQREFVIEGLRICTEAVKNNIKIKKIYCTGDFCNKFREQFDSIFNVCSEVYVVSEEIINKISDTYSSQGIVCVCGTLDYICSVESMKDNHVVVILENIQNPSNLGAIIRTCDAFDINSIIVSKGSSDIYNPKALRGSMGSIFRMKFFISNDIPNVIKELNEYNFLTAAMVCRDGLFSIKDLRDKNKIAVVIGNEGNGLSENTKLNCTSSVSIPMKPSVDSLNVAVASGVVFWELAQRGGG